MYFDFRDGHKIYDKERTLYGEHSPSIWKLKPYHTTIVPWIYRVKLLRPLIFWLNQDYLLFYII